MRRFLPFVAVIGLAVAMTTSCDHLWGLKGSAAPNFQVEPIAQPGKVVQLSDFKGKVVLIDFWASWCGPCRMFAGTVNDLQKKYHAKGLEVLAVSAESRETIEQYGKAEKPNHPLYMDLEWSANKAFDVHEFPRIYVVDREGKIAYAEVDAEAKAVEDAIVKSLG